MNRKELLIQMKDKIEDIRKLSLELVEAKHVPVEDRDANIIQTMRAALGININKLIQDYDEWFNHNCIGCEY